MEMKNVLEIIDAVSKSNIMKFNIEDGDFKLKLDKTVPSIVQNIEATSMPPKVAQPAAVQAVSIPLSNAVGEDYREENIKIIKSPIVGTFYSAAGPEQGDFVKVGDKVVKGQTLCIIEAMKLMNEIESDFDGEIIELLVSNNQMVEYGQPLFRMK